MKTSKNALYLLWVRWMKENGYYSRFVKNCLNNNKRELIEVFEDCKHYDDLMLSGFVFYNTPEGQEYWNDADDDWAMFVHNRPLLKGIKLI